MWLVSGAQQNDSGMHNHISIVFKIIFPYRFLTDYLFILAYSCFTMLLASTVQQDGSVIHNTYFPFLLDVHPI